MANYVAGRTLGRQIRVNDKRAVYRLTGRSPGSRDRVITQVHSGDYDFEFWVKSRKPLPPKDAKILEYQCALKLNTDFDADDIILLGNGIQTADIAKEVCNIIDKAETKKEINEIDYRSILKENLLNHGVEPDNVTPRIACVIKKPKESPVFKEVCFGTIFPSPNGIVRKKGTVPGEVSITTIAGEIYNGVNSLATYKGENPDIEPSSDVLVSAPLPIGTIAQGQHLAEAEYEELQKRYWVVEEEEGQVDTAVATVAIVIQDDGKFSLGVCNRHKVA